MRKLLKPRTKLAKRLRLFREKIGISSKELALALDVSYSTVFAWEIGDRSPSRHTALRYYKFCREKISVQLEDFLSED